MGKTLGHRSRRVGKVFRAVYSPAELRNLEGGVEGQRGHMGWREEEGGLWSLHPDFQHEKRVGYSDWQWGHSLHHPVRHHSMLPRVPNGDTGSDCRVRCICYSLGVSEGPHGRSRGVKSKPGPAQLSSRS